MERPIKVKRSKKGSSQAAVPQNHGLVLKQLKPITRGQNAFYKNFNDSDVSVLSGSSGTGKTLIAIYKALELIEASEDYHKLIIVRSSVAGRKIGFLPGNDKEKMQVFESVYPPHVSKTYGRDDAYSILKQKGIIEFTSTSFLRGLTFNNTIIVVDEVQNMDYQELYTILTRFGDHCKIVLCGDTKQDDLTSERYKEVSGFAEILKILQMVPKVFVQEFGPEDIVRSGFVKHFIIASEGLKIYTMKDSEIIRDRAERLSDFVDAHEETLRDKYGLPISREFPEMDINSLPRHFEYVTINEVRNPVDMAVLINGKDYDPKGETESDTD